MAQSSLPQAGNRNANPPYVDAGPYTGDQWATVYRLLFTGDQQATQGVLRSVWNELAVTNPNPPGLQIRVDTGAGVCNGHVFVNDTEAVTITVDGGANRSDAVCIVENNTNAAIAAGPATNYNTPGNASIPPYSTRLAVVKNAPANFSQTLARYMVRLATITTGAVSISGLTDVRDYCRFATCIDETAIGAETITASMIQNRTRQFLIAPEHGRNISHNLDIFNDVSIGYRPGLPFPDGRQCAAVGDFVVPNDYVSGLTIRFIVNPLNTGNLHAIFLISAGACGEPTPILTTPTATLPVTMGQLNCIMPLSLAGLAAGDVVHVWFARVGDNPLDTINNTVYYVGFLVSYEADS